MAEDSVRVTADALLEICERILRGVGVPVDQARIIAEVTVAADLRGVGSHGVLRLPAYIHRVRAGLMAADTRIGVIRERGAAMLLDAHGGFGQVAGVYAMNRAIERARQHGVGIVAVRNANHIGMAAYYTMLALPHRMVGIAATNAAPSMAAWGGTRPVLGTNPISVAVPTGQEVDIVLDMATSVVARGKIRSAACKGERIPLGWALDAEGRPTEDPEAALKGTLLPIGGPKGYGLALVVDVLAGVLTGSDYSIYLASLHDMSRRASVGFMMQAVDVAAFSDWEKYTEHMKLLMEAIRSSPLAPGVDRIYLPGEIEGLREREYRQAGIPLPTRVLEELQKLAMDLGVRVDLQITR
ncbi:MAG: Ldh family oxidoreductase [Anaerolineae bacterium]|nr:Ldh family oxidoreductase [Anaerolineae bacterium]MDW8067957.1 Ldh family oxidoreductase [Anaerolineae bacterium]